MNLIFRFLRVLIHAFLREPIHILNESKVSFRVWLNDLDLNLHMTNSRYLSVMDLARIDRLVRMGLLKHFFKRKGALQSVVASSYMRFRKSLQPFQKYTVSTKLLGWEGKWFYILHSFEANDQLIGYGLIKGAFLREGKSLLVSDVFPYLTDSSGLHTSPTLPDFINEWSHMEETLKEYMI